MPLINKQCEQLKKKPLKAVDGSGEQQLAASFPATYIMNVAVFVVDVLCFFLLLLLVLTILVAKWMCHCNTVIGEKF